MNFDVSPYIYFPQIAYEVSRSNNNMSKHTYRVVNLKVHKAQRYVEMPNESSNMPTVQDCLSLFPKKATSTC